MADEELTHGEIGRTLDRLRQDIRDTNDRIAGVAAQMVPTTLWSSEHRALQEQVDDVRTEMREGFTRVEATAVERRDAHRAKDKELGQRIDAVASQIGDKAKNATSKTANWIAAGLLALTAAGLLVTILGHGGH